MIIFDISNEHIQVNYFFLDPELVKNGFIDLSSLT